MSTSSLALTSRVPLRAASKALLGITAPGAPSRAMATKDWNAAQYLKFNAERTRPARDLLAQVPLASPARAVDLGCGPGNSTQVLADRYASAAITGMDSSPDMLAKARATLPGVQFSQADLATYEPDGPVDLFFSNAVLQWLPTPQRLQIVARLIQSQPAGGVFAFQVPNNLDEPSHAAMREVAKEGPWAARLAELKPDRAQIETPREIYNTLKPLCSEVNIWQTGYQHPMEGHEGIVEWLKGTGLRPYVDPLPRDEYDGFVEAYLERLRAAYPVSLDGTVLYNFPRLFVVAVRK